MQDRDRPLVANAADPRQVKNAGRKANQAREREIADLGAVLATEHGRRLLMRVLGYCRVFEEVFDDSAQRTAFNVGVRNVGLFVMSEITAADETAFFLMMREHRERQDREGKEAEALRTPSSGERGPIRRDGQGDPFSEGDEL
jgi:hypothetical protein